MMGSVRILKILLCLASGFTCALSDDEVQDCPAFCACSIKVSTRGTLVNCTARNLSNIPHAFPLETEELYLDHNHFTNFDLTKLPFLPKLVKLVISHCKSTSLLSTANINEVLPKLEMIDLIHNELTQVPGNLPKNLRVLHLGYNKIQDIQGTAFSSLKKLKELYLDHNYIRKITSTSFHGESDEEVTLANLDKLSLKRNKIQYIAPKAFENLISLSALNLAKNKLTSLEAKVFYRLLDLEHLDLHGNKLENIEDETLYMLRSLKFLSLKLNQLQSVPRGLPMLEWLDLSHNKIHNISSEHRTDIYPAELFILAHNPLHCDCHLLWLKEIFDSREYLLDHTELKATDYIPTCGSPKRVAGESWEHLGDEMFTCNPEDSEESFDDSSSPEELQVRHGLISDKSVQMIWTHKGRQNYESVFILYYIFGSKTSTSKHIEVSAAQREYSVRHLRPESNYVICVIPKLDLSEEYKVEKIRPLSVEHCVEVVTQTTNLLENVSFLAVAGYYMLGMMGTIIAIFSCIGGLALVYGLWNAKCSDWSAKYAAEAAMPDLDIHTRLSKEEKNQKTAAGDGTVSQTSDSTPDSDSKENSTDSKRQKASLKEEDTDLTRKDTDSEEKNRDIKEETDTESKKDK